MKIEHLCEDCIKAVLTDSPIDCEKCGIVACFVAAKEGLTCDYCAGIGWLEISDLGNRTSYLFGCVNGRRR